MEESATTGGEAGGERAPGRARQARVLVAQGTDAIHQHLDVLGLSYYTPTVVRHRDRAATHPGWS